jgi:hypothetical protein
MGNIQWNAKNRFRGREEIKKPSQVWFMVMYNITQKVKSNQRRADK